MSPNPSTTKAVLHDIIGNYIVQPNGELTNETGKRILDAFTYKHLLAWVGNQFGHTDEHDQKLDTILAFLRRQDADDLEYWLGRTWWDVLTNAEYDPWQ